MSEEIPENAEIPVITEEAVETMGPHPLPTEIIEPEIIADPSIWLSMWDGYTFGLSYIFPAFMLLATYVALRHLLWESLRFNYHHYLKYGEFVLLWGDDGGNVTKRENRQELAKELKMMEDDFASWAASLCMSIFIYAVCAVIAVLWPFTIILVFPLIIVRLIGYRKRKKIVFVQKINGDHLKT